MLGISTQHNEIFSEIICEKCFEQIVDIDSYRKRCRKAQSDMISDLEEMDQKLAQIQSSVRKDENPWFKVEIIETTGDDEMMIGEPHFEVIEEEHLEETVYDDGNQYQTDGSYVHDYSKYQGEDNNEATTYDDDDEQDEEEEADEEEEENMIEIDDGTENVEGTKLKFVGRNVGDVLFNEKDKYTIVDKDAIIKNPDRNSYAYRIYECFFCRLKFAGRKTYKVRLHFVL